MIDKTTNYVSTFCTRYTIFWALYIISIALITMGLIIEICAGDIFTSTIMLICLTASIVGTVFVFRG